MSKLARETGVQDVARGISPWSHLVGLVFARLTHSIGLNDVCDALPLHAGALSTIREARPPGRSGLSHANRERPAGPAEQVFWRRLAHLGSVSPGFVKGQRRAPAFRFKMPIHVLDSTAREWVTSPTASATRSSTLRSRRAIPRPDLSPAPAPDPTAGTSTAPGRGCARWAPTVDEKIVNGGDTPAAVDIALAGTLPAGASAHVIILTGASRADENTFDQPDRVASREEAVALAAPGLTRTFPAWSLSVLRLRSGSAPAAAP